MAMEAVEWAPSEVAEEVELAKTPQVEASVPEQPEETALVALQQQLVRPK